MIVLRLMQFPDRDGDDAGERERVVHEVAITHAHVRFGDDEDPGGISIVLPDGSSTFYERDGVNPGVHIGDKIVDFNAIEVVTASIREAA